MIKRIVWHGFFVVLMGLIFSGFLSEDSVLLTTDAAIKGSNVSPSEVIHRMPPHWNDRVLLGSPRGTGTQLASVLKAFTSGVVWNNLAYGLACLLSSWIFLRRFRSLTPWASVLGALAAFWVGTNFSIVLAGHYFKPYVILFFVCSLLPVSGAAAGSVGSALLWGACVGLMFAQQPDVALFFALFAGAYLVFLLWKEQGLKPAGWLKIMVPAAAMAFLFAAGPLLSGYEHHVKGTAQMKTENGQQKWEYVTQWSVPPDEMADLIAPGYYGWRSNEPDGPYWGRTGRSPGWENTKQGFRNFRLESIYIGMIPVSFALFSLFTFRRSKYRAEIMFWAIAALTALLLSFGKYFPLYTLFYKLPVVNNIRNPNKFIQVFQVCLAILSAYGFDALLRSRKNSGSAVDGLEKPVRNFFWFSLGVLVIMGLVALVAALGKETGIDRFVSQGWPEELAQTIVQNKASALLHAVFMAAVAAAAFAVFSFKRFSAMARYHNGIAAALLLIVAVDAVRLSRHYIQEMPRSYIESNALTDFLHSNLDDQRVAFVSQDGINNIWITYLMPYNRIPTFNFTDMPRMANDYKAFLTAGQRDPLSMWRASAVKYLLASSALEQQLADAGCRKVFTYGLSGTDDGGFRMTVHPAGNLAVYELLGALPRYTLFAGSVKGSDEDALAAMSDFSRVVIDEGATLPELDGEGVTGSISVLSRKPGKVRLRVSSDVPSILRIADRYDPDWRARIDGHPVQVGRVDFIFQGIAVPAGEHDVVLRYAPSRLYFNMQLTGCVVLIFALVVQWKKKRDEGDVED